MSKFTFYLNAILTSLAFIIIPMEMLSQHNEEASVLYLVTLGGYQIITALGITVYYMFTDRTFFIAYLIYWFVVFLFFAFIIRSFIYFSLLIALYHLYLNFCGFSDSKLNIFKSWH